MPHTFAGSLSAFDLSAQPSPKVRAAMPSHLPPLQRAQRDLHACAAQLKRAAAHRTVPFWPFGDLTPAQHAAREAQEQAMRAGTVAQWGAR